MTVIELERVTRICTGCGAEFVDAKRSGAPRSFCETCRPRIRKPAAKSAVAKRLKGKPLSIEEFEDWCGRLKQRDGSSFRLEAWERKFAVDLLSALKGDGRREIWLIVPEGNGKSTIVALVVLYCLEKFPDAWIPVAAAARDQAQIIWTQGERFIRYGGLIHQARPGLRELRFGTGAAKIYAGDADTGDGPIPYPLMVIDELHRHKSLELYRTWAGKLDKENAVLVVISTAGEPGSDFEETRDGMRAVAEEIETEGRFGRYATPTSVLHEYALEATDDPEDLELVKLANPSDRITVETLRAKRTAPAWSLPHWKRLTCNMPTVSTGAGISPQAWAACMTDAEIPAGEPAWYGADYAFVKDTTALVPFWPRDPGFRLLGDASIIVPPADGSQTSVDTIKAEWLRLLARNPALGVVMDLSGARDIAQWLEDEQGVLVVDQKQTNPAAALAYQRWMEGMRNGWLKHRGDPGLTQHVLNARTKILPLGDTRFVRAAESRSVTAEASARRVIDALVAASMVNAVVAAELSNVQTEEPAFAWG